MRELEALFGVPKTVPDVVAFRARITPNSPAFWRRDGESPWRATSWAAFWEAIRALAAALQESGLAAGDRVAVIARPCPEWELADKAILLAGGVVVGIDPMVPAEETARALEAAKVSALVVNDRRSLMRFDPGLVRRARFVVVLDRNEAAGGVVHRLRDLVRRGFTLSLRG